MLKWISCEEDLPGDGDLVLVTDGTNIDVGFFESDDGLWMCEMDLIDPDTITHWMEIPEADEIGEF